MNLVRAFRQVIERRMSISDFDSVLDMIAGGGSPSYTGKLVSYKSAMGVSTFWACVEVHADDFATLPVLPCQWIEPGVSRREARDHYLWPLLTEEANPRQSSHEFKKQMRTWQVTWGNAFAEIETNGRGQVVALWPWHPERVKVWLEDPNDIRTRVKYTYISRDSTTKPVTLDQDQILHVKGTSLDGFSGLSLVQVHRQLLSLRDAKTEFSGRFYGNGVVTSGMVNVPGKITDKTEQSLRDRLDKYRGLSNSHRVLIMEEGSTYTPFSMPLKDAQFIESMGNDDEAIARFMKVPQHRVGLLNRATNNNIVQQALEYVQNVLQPNAANWCGRMHCSLLSARERDSIFLQPDYNYLLAGDPTTRAALYTVLANTGAFSPDDIRHSEGKNPLKGGIGKTPRVPLNTVPLGSDQAKGDKPDPPKIVAPHDPLEQDAKEAAKDPEKLKALFARFLAQYGAEMVQ